MHQFTKKSAQEVVNTGVHALQITCFFYSFVGMIFTSRNFLSGTGDIIVPLVMGITEVICRVLLVIILPQIYRGIWDLVGHRN